MKAGKIGHVFFVNATDCYLSKVALFRTLFHLREYRRFGCVAEALHDDRREVDDAVEVAEVHHVSGDGVRHARDGHFERVVVPVVVRAVALAEDAAVLVIREGRVVQAVRRAEPREPGDGDGRHATRGWKRRKLRPGAGGAGAAAGASGTSERGEVFEALSNV